MSVIVHDSSKFRLTPASLPRIIADLTEALRGRVEKAFVFGSASAGTFRPDSDIDLILVVDDEITPFETRVMAFKDLFKIYPRLDVLVYTPRELDAKLADVGIGFWKSVRLSMKRLI